MVCSTVQCCVCQTVSRSAVNTRDSIQYSTVQRCLYERCGSPPPRVRPLRTGNTMPRTPPRTPCHRRRPQGHIHRSHPPHQRTPTLPHRPITPSPFRGHTAPGKGADGTDPGDRPTRARSRPCSLPQGVVKVLSIVSNVEQEVDPAAFLKV